YVGQKSQEKKVLSYVQGALGSAVTESQLQSLCSALQDLKANRLLRRCLALGRRRFPSNPAFCLLEIDCELAKPASLFGRCPVERLLARLRKLATTLPPNERQTLLAEVEKREEALRERNPFLNLLDAAGLGSLADVFGGEGADEDDWDED